MQLRFRVDICVPVKYKKELEALFDAAEALMAKSVEDHIEQGPIEHIGEPTFLELHKCYHDEAVNKPCEIIKRIEV